MDFTRNRIINNEEGLTKSIAILGVGATGSHLLIELLKLGFTDITVYDIGVVKEHNCTNQAYPIQAVGLPKSEAIEKLAKVRYGVDITVAIAPPVDNTYDFVFNCVDEKTARELYRQNLKWGELFIETAFDVYSSDLFMMTDKELIKSIPTSDEVSSEVTSACGSRLTVSASVNSFVSSVVWAIINHMNGDLPEEQYNKRITFMHYNPVNIQPINEVKPFEWDD